MPDDRIEMQNDPTCTNVGFSVSSLSREDGTCRKRDHKFFMQSPDSRYLAMLGKLLFRATTSVNWRLVSTLESKKKRVLHSQKVKIHI